MQGVLYAERGDQMCETIDYCQDFMAKKVSKFWDFGIEVEDRRGVGQRCNFRLASSVSDILTPSEPNACGGLLRGEAYCTRLTYFSADQSRVLVPFHQ